MREAGLSEEVTQRRLATMAQMRAAGQIRYAKAEEHPNWKGGPEAQRARRMPKQVAWTREYRKKNPHRTREWAQNRRNRKAGKLPYGTIPKIGEMQRWKCAICRAGIRNAYHVDHIMPLAKGGAHEPCNIQLLCATCNVRKNAKDPISYMQELGRLL